jgi:hypothetical protein
VWLLVDAINLTDGATLFNDPFWFRPTAGLGSLWQSEKYRFAAASASGSLLFCHSEPNRVALRNQLWRGRIVATRPLRPPAVGF